MFPEHDNMHPISAEARDLIKNMLIRDPNERISIDGIESHPFFNNTPEPGSIAVFNKEECQQMIREFFYIEDEDYWNSRRAHVLEIDKHELHQFSEINLYSTDSEDDAIGRNMSTKSIILAPRNSSEDEEEIPETNEAFKVKIYAAKKIEFFHNQQDIISFLDNHKVWRLNLQYELENNGKMDNGILNKDADEDEGASVHEFNQEI